MKKKTPSAKRPAKRRPSSATGTYVYDKDSDRVVKVSDRIPRVAGKKGSSAPFGEAPSCGRSSCEGCPGAGGF